MPVLSFLCIYITASSPVSQTYFCPIRENKKLALGETAQHVSGVKVNQLRVKNTHVKMGTFFFKGTNGRQKTYEVSHVYSIFYSGSMCQTTVIFGITKDGSLY